MDGSIWAGVEELLNKLVFFVPRIAAALFVLLFFIIIGRSLGSALVKVLEKSKLTPTHKIFFKNLTTWFFILLGLGISLSVLGLETALAGFLAGSGVAAIVLGFAFREIGENLLSGLFLAISRPFNVGDFIKSESFEGEIREIELRYTHIRTADGRDIYIPNSQMFNKPLINYTRDGLRRPEFTVGIDYSDDPEKACHIILDVIKKITDVLKEPGPNVIINKLAPQYVELEISFWINTFNTNPESSSASKIVQEEMLLQIRSQVMSACRRVLVEEGFTVSANVSTNVLLSSHDENRKTNSQ